MNPATPSATKARRIMVTTVFLRLGQRSPVRPETVRGASWNRTSDLTLIRGAL